MQAPTTQERDHLDQMDIVIGLSNDEERCLLHVWRACDQTATAHAPKQVIDEFRRTVRERRDLSISRMLRLQCALDSRFAVKARKMQEMIYNSGVPVEAI